MYLVFKAQFVDEYIIFFIYSIQFKFLLEMQTSVHLVSMIICLYNGKKKAIVI